MRSEAAIRLPDGRLFTASCHAFAMEKAADAGYPDATCERSELGFSRPDRLCSRRADAGNSKLAIGSDAWDVCPTVTPKRVLLHIIVV